MASETEVMALALVRLLYEATDGKSLQWQPIRPIDKATVEAVQLAAARGWLAVDGARSVMLTAAGRELAEDLAQTRH